MNELAVREAELTPAQQTLSMIANAAADPACDVEKMRALITMQNDLVAMQAKSDFGRAMVAAQNEMRPVLKNCKGNKGVAYANLEAIDRAIKPIYLSHGFVITFHIPEISGEGSNEKLKIEATLYHKGGHSEKYSMFLGNDAKGAKGGDNKTEVQGAGSSFSYAKRYLTCGIFNVSLSNEDNDGAGLHKGITLEQERTINDLLSILGISQTDDTFLAWAGADAIQHIHPGKYQQVVDGLKKRIEKAK